MTVLTFKHKDNGRVYHASELTIPSVSFFTDAKDWELVTEPEETKIQDKPTPAKTTRTRRKQVS